MTRTITRRRVIQIAAACVSTYALNSFGSATHVSAGQRPFIWKGMALGAEAQIQIYHDDQDRAKAALESCRHEITRLENQFSLYRDTSEVSRLNRQGSLCEPSIEFIELLSRAKSFSKLTEGAFDVTVQPLWEMYVAHYSQSAPNPQGPSEEQIAAVLNLVGSDKIDISTTRISLGKQGMRITLNGVAQGFITERIADKLSRAGYGNILVHLGETQALGGHPDGRPWKAAIPVPADDSQTLTTVPLVNQALATSGAYGSPISRDGNVHHLLDPRTGRSANLYQSVSVIAPGATNADMLSTAISILPVSEVKSLLEHFSDTQAIILNNENEIIRL